MFVEGGRLTNSLSRPPALYPTSSLTSPCLPTQEYSSYPSFPQSQYSQYYSSSYSPAYVPASSICPSSPLTTSAYVLQEAPHVAANPSSESHPGTYKPHHQTLMAMSEHLEEGAWDPAVVNWSPKS